MKIIQLLRRCCFSFLLTGLLFAMTDLPANAQFSKIKDKAKQATQRTKKSGSNASSPREAPKTRQIVEEPVIDGTPEERQFAIDQGKLFIEAYDETSGLPDPSPRYGYNNWDTSHEFWRERLEEAERTAVILQDLVRPIADRFGDAPEDIEAAYERLLIDDFRDLESTHTNGVAGRYKSLYRDLEILPQMRRDAAEAGLEHALWLKSTIESGESIPERRVELVGRIRQALETAQWFDPQNQAVNEELAGLGALMEAAVASIAADIVKGRLPSASGPTQHTQGALEFFKTDELWGGKAGSEALRVWVAGPWRVTEKDLLGRPIQWGLPAYVALTKPHLRDLNAARVFEVTVLARQGSPAPQAAPFIGAWVGDSWLVSLDQLDK